MKSIEDHIEHDKKIADDPQANPAARRHAKEELHELEEYVEHHKKDQKKKKLNQRVHLTNIRISLILEIIYYFHSHYQYQFH